MTLIGWFAGEVSYFLCMLCWALCHSARYSKQMILLLKTTARRWLSCIVRIGSEMRSNMWWCHMTHWMRWIQVRCWASPVAPGSSRWKYGGWKMNWTTKLSWTELGIDFTWEKSKFPHCSWHTEIGCSRCGPDLYRNINHISYGCYPGKSNRKSYRYCSFPQKCPS